MIEKFVIEVDYADGCIYIREMPEDLRRGEEFGVFGGWNIASYSMPEFSLSERKIYLQGDEYDADDEPLYCGTRHIEEVKNALKLFCKKQKLFYVSIGEAVNLGEI